MTEKQQQLLFDKGITNVPSDALCSDNALSESVGMVYDNGEHRVVQKPVGVPGLEARYDMLFVHTFNGEKRYVYKLGSGVYWRKASDSMDHLLLTDSSNPQVTAIGKTLIITDANGMHHFRYKQGGYDFLSFPIPNIGFEAKLVSNVQSPWFADNTGKTDGIIEAPESTGFRVVGGEQEAYNNLVVGLYRKNLKDIATNKGFAEPFLIRAALEMYDGSYTYITNPILLYPSVTENTKFYIYGLGAYSDLSMPKQIVAITQMLRLYIRQTTDYSEYTDLIKDVVLFASKPISLYRTTQDQPITNHVESSASDWDFADNVSSQELSGTAGIGSSVYREIKFQPPVSSHELTLKATTLRCLQKREQKSIDDDIAATSLFYKIATLGTKSISNFVDFAAYTTQEVTENLTSQEYLKYDDYYSRSKLNPKMTYVYNARLNIANVSRSFFAGFGYFMPFDHAETDTNQYVYTFDVTIKTDAGEVTVRNEVYETEGIKQKHGIYFYYPDSRANRVKIYKNTYGEQDAKLILDAALKEHPALNGAYYFAGFRPTTDEPTGTPTQDGTVPTYSPPNPEILSNNVIQSEVNNPWVFLASGYHAVGIGEVIGMSTITQALSEGQFGAYPLLVFATDGIWAMSVDKTGLYQTVHPMSREVALKDNPCLTQTDGAVFFISKKGLMAVIGNQVRCMSPQLSGKNIPSAFQTADLGDAMSFFYNCMIAYDYRDSLLWIMNSAYNKCYIYSIGSGVFGKYDFGNYNNTSPIVPMCVVNDYPDYLICTTTSVLSLLNRPTINSDVNSYSGTMISRPMKLENAFALKSLMHINHIHTLSEGASLEFGIYGSNDLRNWVGLTSLRGTPWLYYRFRYNFSKMKAVDRFAGTLAVTQERRTNKPRTYNSLGGYSYSFTSTYLSIYDDIEIPSGESQAIVLLDAQFFRQKGNAAKEAVECYWSLRELKKNGTYIELDSGFDDNMSKRVTVTTETSSVLICTNVDEEPDPRKSTVQASLPINVRKVGDESEYSYSVSVSPNQIAIPQGEDSVEAYVSAYAMRSANGNTEAFDCYIKAWKVIGNEYTAITGNTQRGSSLAFVAEFDRNSTDVAAYVIFTISNDPISDTWTGNYLATSQNIVIDSSSSVTPEPRPSPTPEPTPTPTPSGDNPVISIDVNITNNTSSPVTLDGRLRFILGNPDHNGNYYGGYLGSYIRTDSISFRDGAVVIQPGETKTYTNLSWRDGDTGCGLGETSPLNPNQLPILDDHGEVAYARNILLYTGGRSDVTLCDNLDPSTIFQEGGVYNISITSA